MKNLSLILFLCSNFLFADYLYQPSSVCVKSFYYKSGTLYYVLSDTGVTVSTATKNLGDDIFPDYEYNITSGRCQKTQSNNTLGLSNQDFNYLSAFIGLTVLGLVCIGFFL
ncbi:hypothetical protein [Sulfurospirillum oryzae]|uniref:hypothetical protein n=1 Tax=Sulfurospirillum oryzae TaxID=2976535 RepID=UPI0021E75B72|nr:hypothetical protein [Sulfurospirillum oryzae]